MLNSQEKLKNLIKHDAWSDFVTGGLSSIGITQKDRDAVQPAVNQLQNAVYQQVSTTVPPKESGVFSTLMPGNDLFVVNGNLTTISKILVAVIVGIFIYLLVRIRK